MNNQVRLDAQNVLYDELDHKDSVLQANYQKDEVHHVPIQSIVDPKIVGATMIMCFMTFKNWIPFAACKVPLHRQTCKNQLSTISYDGDFTHDI